MTELEQIEVLAKEILNSMRAYVVMRHNYKNRDEARKRCLQEIGRHAARIDQICQKELKQ